MGADKALIPYLGKPLIQYSIDLALSFTHDILISANNHHFDDLGFPVVNDIFRVKAPLAGIHAGLTASRNDWNLILTCDMPNISAELISRLSEQLNGNLRMVVPQHDGFLEPLCGFYHRDLIPVIEGNYSAGKLSLLDLPGAVSHLFVSMDNLLPHEIAHLFRNVNERKDIPGYTDAHLTSS